MTKIYVIAPSEDGPCKIGMSSNPKIRFAAIQTGHHEPLTMWSTWESDYKDAREVEYSAHRHFADKRLCGEWFDIPVKAAEDYLGAVDEEQDGYRWVCTHALDFPLKLFTNTKQKAKP